MYIGQTDAEADKGTFMEIKLCCEVIPICCNVYKMSILIDSPAGSRLELSCCSLLHVVRGD